jgi:hypothetical protein
MSPRLLTGLPSSEKATAPAAASAWCGASCSPIRPTVIAPIGYRYDTEPFAPFSHGLDRDARVKRGYVFGIAHSVVNPRRAQPLRSRLYGLLLLLSQARASECAVHEARATAPSRTRQCARHPARPPRHRVAPGRSCRSPPEHHRSRPHRYVDR